MLHVNKSTVHVVHGEGWQPGQAWEVVSCLGCVRSDDRCCGGRGQYWERGPLHTSDWWLVSADRPWLSGLDWSQRLWASKGQGQAFYYLLVSGSDAICHFVRTASNIYVHYSFAQKNNLIKLLSLGEVLIPFYFVFVVYGYRQHRECGWQSSRSLRCHTYLIPSNYEIKHTVVFAYESYFDMFKESKIGSGKKSGTGCEREQQTSKNDKFDNEKVENECDTSENTNFAETLD